MTELEEKLEKCEQRCKDKSQKTAMLTLHALYDEKGEHKQFFLEEILKVALSEKGYKQLTSNILPKGVQKYPPDAEAMWIEGIKPEDYTE